MIKSALFICLLVFLWLITILHISIRIFIRIFLISLFESLFAAYSVLRKMILIVLSFFSYIIIIGVFAIFFFSFLSNKSWLFFHSSSFDFISFSYFFLFVPKSFSPFSKTFSIYIQKRYLKDLRFYKKSSTIHDNQSIKTDSSSELLKRQVSELKTENLRLMKELADLRTSHNNLRKNYELSQQEISSNKKYVEVNPIDPILLDPYIQIVKEFHTCSKERSVLLLNFMYLLKLANLKIHKNWSQKNTFTFGELLTALVVNPKCLSPFDKDLQKTWFNHLNSHDHFYMTLFSWFNIQKSQHWRGDLEKILNDAEVIFDRKKSMNDLKTDKKSDKNSDKTNKIFMPFQIRFFKELHNFFSLLNQISIDFLSINLSDGLLSEENLVSCKIMLDWMKSQSSVNNEIKIEKDISPQSDENKEEKTIPPKSDENKEGKIISPKLDENNSDTVHSSFTESLNETKIE